MLDNKLKVVLINLPAPVVVSRPTMELASIVASPQEIDYNVKIFDMRAQLID